MARMDKQHKLEGFDGQVGRHLKLDHKADGRRQVAVHATSDRVQTDSQWQLFKAAVAYARKAQKVPEYQHEAEARHTTAFKVATADFLHPPDITRVDVSNYHGQVGDPIIIEARDEVVVTQVGVLLIDEENHLLEMGLARQEGPKWVYHAAHEARHHHIRVVVDAADLPGHIAERRAEIDV